MGYCSWELEIKSRHLGDGMQQSKPPLNYASALTKYSSLPIITMITLAPLVLPTNVDREKFADFGREVKDIHPGNCTADEFNEIEEALYKVFFI